jgi:hypothetical protein
MTDIAPKFGSISAATQKYGVGRSSMYLLSNENPDLIVKFGAKSLVDYGVMDRIMASLPRGLSKIRFGKAKPTRVSKCSLA